MSSSPTPPPTDRGRGSTDLARRVVRAVATPVLTENLPRALREATKTRTRNFLFVVGAGVGVLIGVALGYLVALVTPISIIQVGLMIAIPCAVLTGLLATRLPLRDYITGEEALALERHGDWYQTTRGGIAAHGEELREAGVDDATITARLKELYTEAHQRYQAGLDTLLAGSTPGEPPALADGSGDATGDKV